MLDDLLTELGEESHFYQLMARLLLTEPSGELLADLAKISVPEEADDAMGRGLRRLGEEARRNVARLAEWQEELTIEYTRLFVGPKALVAVPYASFYLSETRSLMTDETIEVRKKYLEGGLAVKNLHRVPDDHIGIELEFIYHLTREALAAAKAGRAVDAENLMDFRDKFISGHFLLWAPIFADKLLEAASEDFYRAAARLLLAVTHESAALVS